jgi:hypothetical protein
VYALRTPAPPLQRFIEHYWFVNASARFACGSAARTTLPSQHSSDLASVDLRVEVFVDARADLIFNFGAPYIREVLGAAGPAAVEHAHSNLDAQRVEPIRIHQRGLVRSTGVRFRLGGLAPFAIGLLRPFTGRTRSLAPPRCRAATSIGCSPATSGSRPKWSLGSSGFSARCRP